jgi:hypothetical protein
MGWNAGNAPPFTNPAAGGWTPIQFGADLTNWIDETSVVNVAGVAHGWNDLGPAGNDWPSFMGFPSGPTISLFTNGLDGVHFDGVSQSIEGPNSNLVFSNAQALAVWIICRQDGDGGVDATGPGYFHLPPYMADNGNSIGIYQRTVTGVDTTVVGSRAAPSTTRNSTGQGHARTPMCVKIGRGAGSNLMSIAIGNAAPTTFLMDDPLDLAGMTTLSLGRSASGGFLACTIGEMFAIDREPTGPEAASASAYITGKWGVAA